MGRAAAGRSLALYQTVSYSVEGTKVVIMVPYQFHYDVLNKDHNPQVVEKAIDNTYDVSCEVTFLSPDDIQWLKHYPVVSPDGRYRHSLILENRIARYAHIGGLSAYVQAAHADARRHLRELAAISLDPLEEIVEPAFDPAYGYPEALHPETLKGYFGEIIAGYIAENFSPFGISEWCVPAFLFQMHKTAFEQLERLRQTGGIASRIPGRTGDDCVAFQRDAAGRIRRALACEAKCTASHDAGLIADAHEKISETFAKPTSIPQLIEVLKGRTGDPDAPIWTRALQRLWLQERGDPFERCDMVSYVYGRKPIRDPTWMNTTAPHAKYTGGRRLEAVEIHLHDVEGVIRSVYGMGSAR